MPDADASSLVSSAVLANAQAERERNARIYGAATGQRLGCEAMLLTAINTINAEVNGAGGFTPRLALAQELGRLAVGAIFAKDSLPACERAIAQLADFAAAIEDERAEDQRKRAADEAARAKQQQQSEKAPDAPPVALAEAAE